jgi:uroporphyrinogen decarboxylase
MAEMTPGERLAISAQGGEPDRVPVSLHIHAWSYAQLYGPNSFQDYTLNVEKNVNAAVWACQELGMDTAELGMDTTIMAEAIAEASGMPYPTTYWDDFIPQHAHRLYEGDPLQTIAYGDPLVRTMRDAEKLVPADPYKHGRLPLCLEAIQLVNKKLEGKYPVGGMCEFAVSTPGILMGWTQMFIAMEKDLPLWKKVEDVVLKSSYEFTKAMVKAGVGALGSLCHFPQWVGSEAYLANPVWMHADHPIDLIERVAKDFGMGIAIHPCTVGPFLNGIKAFKTWLDHTPAFSMSTGGGADDLAEAKRELAPAVIIGNLAPVGIMLQGSPSDVETACIELIQKCAPGGRYVLSGGCEIPVYTPGENVQAVIDTVNKYGRYPIKI